MENPKISIIIPTYNEAANIGSLVRYLLHNANNSIAEILVCDGHSTDNSVVEAKNAGATVLSCKSCGRASQMNYAASKAIGNVLYFLHADSTPPETYASDIVRGLQTSPIGCFRMKFDSAKFGLKINSFFTRFNGVFSGGGDQSLYVTKDLFQELKGFDEYWVIMEDFDLVRRLRSTGRQLHILPTYVTASARKYENNSYVKVNLVNFWMFVHFFKGTEPKAMKSLYKKLLSPPDQHKQHIVTELQHH